jgi:hypothetical protein
VAELAHAFSSLLGDLQTAQKIADRARRDFVREWNLELVTSQYESLYGRIMR